MQYFLSADETQDNNQQSKAQEAAIREGIRARRTPEREARMMVVTSKQADRCFQII